MSKNNEIELEYVKVQGSQELNKSQNKLDLQQEEKSIILNEDEKEQISEIQSIDNKQNEYQQVSNQAEEENQLKEYLEQQMLHKNFIFKCVFKLKKIKTRISGFFQRIVNYYESLEKKYPRLFLWLKRIIILIYHLSIVFLILASTFFFYYLERSLPLTITTYFTQTLIPGSVLGLIFILSLYKFISRWYYPIILIDIIAVGFAIDQFNLYHYRRHGQSLSQIFLEGFVVSSLIYMFLILLYKLLVKYRMKGLLIDIVILLLIALYVKIAILQNSCNYFTKGIKSELIQEEPFCRVPIPQYCWYGIFNKFQDYSKFLDCDKHVRTDPRFYQYKYPLFQGELYPVYAIPDIGSLDKSERYYKEMPVAVQNKVSPFFTLQEAWDAGYEVAIDVKNNFELRINVQRREQVYLPLQNIKSNSLSKNVLLLYIDALGRPSFQLKMKKLTKYLASKNERLFEFLRYHSSLNYTGENYRKFFFGEYNNEIWQNELRNGKLQSVIKYFKENGFVTGHAQDDCHIMSYWFYKDYASFEHEEPYDHDGTGFSCDPYLEELDTLYGIVHDNLVGANAITRRCIFGKDSFEHVLEFGKQFWNAYREDKKFLMLEFMDAHEGSGEVVTYLDEPLTRFLENADLNDTTIILMSDHGWHMRSFFYMMHAEQVYIEANQPFLFIVLPENVMEKQPQIVKNLESNQQVLFDGIAIYSTFRVLAGNFRPYLFRLSLFEELQKNKSCFDVLMNTSNIYHCSCFPFNYKNK